MQEFYLNSKGKGKIYCRVWEPEGEPRAMLQIVHGIAEHVTRYDAFAEFLTAHGFLVAAEDHMGHGKSIGEGDVQGFFTGGWYAAVEDSRQLQQWMMQAHPGVPCFLLGHSMGSFMARTMLFRYADSGIRGAIISGTGWQPGLTLFAARTICRQEEKKFGETGISPKLNKLMFSGYNKNLTPHRTDFDWLSRDTASVDKYIADPLCGFDATIGLTRDMLQGIADIQKRENLAKMKKDLPVLFLSGAEDPVGNRSKGVNAAADAFRRCGMQNVSVKLYAGGRHEMLNETCKDTVYADILAWLEQTMN